MSVIFKDGTMVGKIKSLAYDGVPTGTVLSFAGNTAPSNYLLCDGSAVSRITYADLFNVIGTTYGAGDGSSTFNLPNLVDRFVEGGSASGTVKNAGLPNITGRRVAIWGGGDGDSRSKINGCFRKDTDASIPVTSDGPNYTINEGGGFAFDASLSNPIYGASDTVQPHAIVMKYIIKI